MPMGSGTCEACEPWVCPHCPQQALTWPFLDKSVSMQDNSGGLRLREWWSIIVTKTSCKFIT